MPISVREADIYSLINGLGPNPTQEGNKMGRRIKVAACQGIWTTDPDTNIRRMETFIEGISKDWGDSVKLVGFTEYAVHGFDPSRLQIVAETIPGRSTDKICEIARKYKYWVCCGSMVEKRGSSLHNTSLLISPEGEITLKYVKTHPWCDPGGGELGVIPGREFPVADIPGIGKVGIMICSDAVYPEVARTLAWKGAELIIWPTMAFHPLRNPLRSVAVARAWENNCYLMAIMGTGQHVGIGLSGHSMIVDPDGLILTEVGDGETILVDTIDLDNVTISRTDGGRGLTPVFRFMRLYGHKYEPYSDFAKGAVFDQIEPAV
jgi:formamidase